MKTTIGKLVEIIEGNILTDNTIQDNIVISGGFVSDLLSDVMGNAQQDQVWITIMRHLNVVAVATLTGVSAVIFSKDIVPEQAVITKANEEGVCLLNSTLNTFELTGRLYNLLDKS